MATDAQWDWHDTVLEPITHYRLHNAEFCGSVTRSIPEPSAKPTIEQLAADYRNKLDYSKRKQQEADAAKAEADAALGELVAAGKAIDLVIGIVTPQQELVITDWRDLQPMDEIKCTQVNTWGGNYADHVIGAIGVVLETEGPKKSGQTVKALFGHDEVWISGWEFIRRP